MQNGDIRVIYSDAHYGAVNLGQRRLPLLVRRLGTQVAAPTKDSVELWPSCPPVVESWTGVPWRWSRKKAS